MAKSKGLNPPSIEGADLGTSVKKTRRAVVDHPTKRRKDGTPMRSTTKLTPETIDCICARIAKGSYMRPAALACGISETTLWRWLKKGEAEPPGGKYREFLERVKEAEAIHQETLVHQWDRELRKLEGVDAVKHIPVMLEKRHKREWKAAAETVVEDDFRDSKEWKELVSVVLELDKGKRQEAAEKLLEGLK